MCKFKIGDPIIVNKKSEGYAGRMGIWDGNNDAYDKSSHIILYDIPENGPDRGKRLSFYTYKYDFNYKMINIKKVNDYLGVK